ncbi:putative membrane protein [Granulicella aggregans]|uniref:Putative membrane protein n=1 Tax=Granulicella aggregans TaxID=474949 RepID=A0A7W7ZC37_9BACT|nr:TMEM175 family protein [Granulicella aggregans]MBB5057098.1 putative membrane protein [Granulicella aggregans]
MSKKHATPARLEAFSDGVIAVIITIMVLELKVPVHDGFAGFATLLPTLAIYALSFSFTGVYWINHHHLVHRTDQADERTLYANLFFLFWLSLLPFFTGYLLDKKMDSFSVLLYVLLMIMTGASFMWLRLTIGRYLRETGRLEQEDAEAERKHWISLGLYIVAALCSFPYPRIALGIVALVMVVWVLPTSKIDPIEHCIDVHTEKHQQT